MRYSPSLAAAILAGLGAVGGVFDPLSESRRAMYDDFPRATHRRGSSTPRDFDREAARKKNKAARTARRKARRRADAK